MDIIVDDIINKRPFFSIIVPCYNSKKERIRDLLQSIYDAGCRDEIELIIADGRSTDKEYQEEVKQFIDETGIDTKIVDMSDSEDLICCPGNTRECGVSYATGEWVTFIDHDDCFTENALQKVKKAIIDTDQQYIVCSNFLQIIPEDGKVLKEVKYATNWMHGKFYNLDNFWKAFNFHFKTNLVSNEDIYISSRVHCILNKLSFLNKVLWVEDFTYLWKMWPDSTSHIKYSDKLSYMEYYFYDYIVATYDVYTDEYNLLCENSQVSENDKFYYIQLQADSLLFQFLYLQSFKFKNKNYLLEHEMVVKKNIREYYRRFNIDPAYLYALASEELDNDDIRDGGIITKIWYNSIRYSVTESCGNFIEVDNFREFISNV